MSVRKTLHDPWNEEPGASRRVLARLQKARGNWYRIEKNVADPEVAEVYIYDEIGFWGTTAADFVQELRKIEESTIRLHLNSPGGEVYDGIAIFNALRNHAATVEVSVDGLAASAASFIAMAGDKVVMQPHSRMMIHDAWGIAIGPAETMRKMADRLDKGSNNIASIYAERAGGTTEEWRARMLEETWYTDHEAVEAGLADEVAGDAGEDADADRLIAKFDMERFRHPPEELRIAALALREKAAGRTMSQANLDKLHSVMDQLDAIHDGVCDMDDDCPIEGEALAEPDEIANEPPSGPGAADRLDLELDQVLADAKAKREREVIELEKALERVQV